MVSSHLPPNVCVSTFTAIIELLLACEETLSAVQRRSHMKC